MKRIIAFIILLCICLSLCACGEESANSVADNIPQTTQVTTRPKYKPNKEDLVEAIKDNFKDPDSVQVVDGYWAWSREPDELNDGEYRIICTIRAKNSFGGYGNPESYDIYGGRGYYHIAGQKSVYSAEQLLKFFRDRSCEGEIYTLY